MGPGPRLIKKRIYRAAVSKDEKHWHSEPISTNFSICSMISPDAKLSLFSEYVVGFSTFSNTTGPFCTHVSSICPAEWESCQCSGWMCRDHCIKTIPATRNSCKELNVGKVMPSITQPKSFLIDVIIRNQDIKKLETTCFGLTLAIYRFHLEKLFVRFVIQFGIQFVIQFVIQDET